MKTKKRKLRKSITILLLILESVCLIFSLIICCSNFKTTMSLLSQFKFFCVGVIVIILGYVNFVIFEKYGNSKITSLIFENGEEK